MDLDTDTEMDREINVSYIFTRYEYGSRYEDELYTCIYIYIVRAYREIDISYIGTRYGCESRYEDRLYTCVYMSYVDTER